MYRMMFHAINHESMMAIQVGMETLGNAGTLALGIVVVSTIMRLLTVRTHM